MRTFLLILLIILPTVATAELPKLTARINDYAHLLSPETAEKLEQKLAELEQQESSQIALLTVTSLGGMPIEQYALGVAEKWQLGQKKKDNGALLLIAQNDRKIRIEVGYGLENRLTDLLCGRIIRNIIAPHFKRGDFDLGISKGMEAMIGTVKGEYVNSSVATGHDAKDMGGFTTFMVIVMLAIGNIFRKRSALAGMAGAIALPLFSVMFFGVQMPLLLLLIPGGFFVGFIASLMAASTGRSGSANKNFSRKVLRGNRGHRFSRNKGFHGGGGGFGGGGASGSW